MKFIAQLNDLNPYEDTLKITHNEEEYIFNIYQTPLIFIEYDTQIFILANKETIKISEQLYIKRIDKDILWNENDSDL